MTNDKKTVSMSTVKPKKESRSVLGRWWLVFGSCHVDDTACETKEEADLGFNESCHEAIVEVIAVTEHDRIVADYESRLTKMSRFNNDALDGQEKLEAELEIARALILIFRRRVGVYQARNFVNKFALIFDRKLECLDEQRHHGAGVGDEGSSLFINRFANPFTRFRIVYLQNLSGVMLAQFPRPRRRSLHDGLCLCE